MSMLDPSESPFMRMLREGKLKRASASDSVSIYGKFFSSPWFTPPKRYHIGEWLIIGELEDGCTVLRKGETILEMHLS